jgi:hypothetical protein
MLYLIIFPLYKLKGYPQILIGISSRLDISKKRDNLGSLGKGFLVS